MIPRKIQKGCDKPKECTGDIGYDLRISGGDGRIGRDLTKIPLGTMGPNEAFRLLGYFERSVQSRIDEAKRLGGRRFLDKGHRDRLNKEEKIRDDLRRKSKGSDC